MKHSLGRFAKDFTKLSEYFGVDDYDNIGAKEQNSKDKKIKEEDEHNSEKGKLNYLIKRHANHQNGRRSILRIR